MLRPFAKWNRLILSSLTANIQVFYIHYTSELVALYNNVLDTFVTSSCLLPLVTIKAGLHFYLYLRKISHCHCHYIQGPDLHLKTFLYWPSFQEWQIAAFKCISLRTKYARSFISCCSPKFLHIA